MNSEKTNVLNRRRRVLTGLYVTGLILVRGNLGFSEVEKTPPEKPKVAVLPLAGDGRADERERAVFSIRQKLDRQGVYEPIDAYTMKDLLGKHAADLKTPASDVIDWTGDESPTVIIWGELGSKLQVHIYDARDKSTKDFSADLPDVTQMRFAVEKLVDTLPGSKPFEHPDEVAVHDDPAADKLWKDGPNLCKEGTFDSPGDWRGILMKQFYPPPVTDEPPGEDQVVIRREGKEQYLAMNLSKGVAESNGLACLGGKIPIQPNTRYRISFRYRSDGPTIHPFIKGYIPVPPAPGSSGDTGEREIYRRQVPPSGSTRGQWVTVVDDLNPQHPSLTVQYLRVDLYAYLAPGTVEFDDIVIKAVGEQTRHAKDDALGNTDQK